MQLPKMCERDPAGGQDEDDHQVADDSWEQFFGASTDLMPSIMDAMDALLAPRDAKRSCQAHHFPNLSANVQKILANLPPDDADARGADEALLHVTAKRLSMRGAPPPLRTADSLDVISANVQKMIANLPDGELVVAASPDVGTRPLGNYLHRPSGIASRTPAGRKSRGQFVQIPSESTNSTLSSEVSRPVSLTSLGSCSSSSSSSGFVQPGSTYLASAESLDSDNEPAGGSQGSADSGITESATMGADVRVLHEVLDTEAVYVDDLQHVIEGYLKPWRADPNCPLQEHLADLFSNLEEIHKFNKGLLDDLRCVPQDATHIANVFLKLDSGFSIYTEYCTNYPRTMTILTQLTRDELMAQLFRERQHALGHALPLGSYLLKPVQRILKYHLFLQRLSKQCAEQHRCAVELALATMTAVATHINTMKRRHEHAVRVQEIQAQLYGWPGEPLTALGELIAEGTFRVGGARGRRHVFLFDKLLMMAKSKADGALAYKTHIMCANLMLVEQVRSEPLSFHVLPFDKPSNQYTLRARSTQHKREWTLQIKRAILENYNAVIPNHARQLVMQLGQDASETEEYCDASSPVKQHTTPQYLERRGRLRKTRDFSASARRAGSHERAFPSLGKWRRQSDPSGCQQFKAPKKAAKAKKADGSVFYTDLSDSEAGDAPMAASLDSLNVIEEHRLDDGGEVQLKADEQVQQQRQLNTIAQVVTDLLMQNEDFHKVLSRQKRNMKGSHSCCGNKDAWQKKEEDRLQKSDSLPRSFQLTDSANGFGESVASPPAMALCESTTSLQDGSTGSLDNDCDDRDEEENYPEHKIYRKSIVRFSLLQKFRAILSEDSKGKIPVYKQGSKSMGAKIAHPDYVDPQPAVMLSAPAKCAGNDDLESFQLPPASSDMSINGIDVLKELDRRIASELRLNAPVDAAIHCHPRSPDFIISSQNSTNGSSYYESLLDKRLTEEESKMQKSDSFRSTADEYKPLVVRKAEVKRPTKAPPPVPAKPKFLLSKHSEGHGTTLAAHTAPNCGLETNQKGWVKTIIDRFE